MQKQQVVFNEWVTVSWSYSQQYVTVVNNKTQDVRIFGGWASLYDVFTGYFDAFTPQIDYETTITYFTPNIGNLIIHAK